VEEKQERYFKDLGMGGRIVIKWNFHTLGWSGVEVMGPFVIT
jgi:hypothetical protein